MSQHTDRTYQRLVSFATAAAAVAYGGSLSHTLDAICAQARQTTGLAAVQILLIDPASTRLGLHGAAPVEDFGPGFSDTLEEVRRRGAEFMSVRSLLQNRTLINPGRRALMLADPAWQPLHDHLRAFDWDDFITVPLHIRDTPIGGMNGYCRPGQALDDDDLTFLRALADQVSIAVQHARLHAETTARRTDDERRRLAQGLHDSACQELFSINLHAQAIERLLPAPARSQRISGNANPDWLPLVRQHVETITSLTDCALQDLREVVHGLYPDALLEDGCLAVVGRLATSIAERDDLAVEVTMPDDRLRTSAEVDLEVYHVVREALHNIVKHAHATRASIVLQPDDTDPTRLLLTVTDNGRGLPVERIPGMGLRSMRDRIERLGGRIIIDNNPGGTGTLVRAVIPDAIEAAPAAAAPAGAAPAGRGRGEPG